MTQEVTEDRLFVLAEDPIPTAGAKGIGALSVGGNNCTDVAEANDTPNLL